MTAYTDSTAYALDIAQVEAWLGVRALERTVERLLVQPLVRALLTERFSDGTSIRVEAVGGGLACTPASPSGGTTR